MRKVLTILFLALCIIANAQTTPSINFVNSTKIQGKGEINSTIHISTKDESNSEFQTTVDENGTFEFIFPNTVTTESIFVWSTNSNNKSSVRVSVNINNPKTPKRSSETYNFISPQVAGQTINYKATIWNTNFSIPLARFNFTKDSQNKRGDLILFNSIGAGFGISWGELAETRDSNGNLINQDFVNTIGIHLGFLFSAGTGDDTKNVFAPTINISILDFQLGLGYELGNLSENQKPVFLTLSYAIPLYKLKKGGFWIWKNSEPIDNIKHSRLGG